MTEFFADTYAFIEFVKGNRKYLKYFTMHSITTTRLNLVELYYCTLRESGETQAENYYNSFLVLATRMEDNTLKKAMKLRLKLNNEGRNISYSDAIGYQIAIEKKIKFLTGDREFKGLENTEFVR